jgi:hypothetical protein
VVQKSITYFFTDDSLLFCRANVLKWAHLQSILDLYESASRQKLNRNKTFIFFSNNTKVETKQFITHLAGVSASTNFEKYLGRPVIVGISRVNAFGSIKGRIWERMNGWKENFLSQGGKEVLLKVVVQAIPTYTITVFQLPKTLCRDINSLMSKFWWGIRMMIIILHG